MDEPVGLAFNPVSGNLYVAEAWNKRIQEFDPNGFTLRTFDVNMWFQNRQSPNRPYLAVSPDGTLIYVTDMDDRHRIVAYNLAGQPVYSFNQPDDLNTGLLGLRSPAGMAFGSDGRFYVVDADQAKVFVFHRRRYRAMCRLRCRSCRRVSWKLCPIPSPTARPAIRTWTVIKASIPVRAATPGPMGWIQHRRLGNEIVSFVQIRRLRLHSCAHFDIVRRLNCDFSSCFTHSHCCDAGCRVSNRRAASGSGAGSPSFCFCHIRMPARSVHSQCPCGVGSGVVNAVVDAHDSQGTYLGSAYLQLDLTVFALYPSSIEYKSRPVDTVTFRVFQDPGASPALAPQNQDLNIYDSITVLAGCDRASGCDAMIPLDGAVVGTFLTDATLYGKPGEPTGIVIEAGKTYHVLGLDESKEYYMILISGARWRGSQSGLSGRP
jgi:hypothetical protein